MDLRTFHAIALMWLIAASKNQRNNERIEAYSLNTIPQKIQPDNSTNARGMTFVVPQEWVLKDRREAKIQATIATSVTFTAGVISRSQRLVMWAKFRHNGRIKSDKIDVEANWIRAGISV